MARVNAVFAFYLDFHVSPLILKIYNFFAIASKCFENNRHSAR